VTSTKDASTINAENLENYDVVIFYTTGDLTEEGNDGHPPMREEGLDELLAWVRNGGGLLGFHSASDTFHRNANPHAPESPFLEMLGGEFLTHGPQFMGRLITVSTEHPTMEGIPEDWEIHDEWYCFEHLSEDRMHVLALLDSREQRELQLRHNLPNYPIIWCSSEGDGRVYYNAMGHREDVWDNETFQRMVTNAINWAKGDGPTMTEPNYAEHMPISIKPVGR
jgi:type 1 glutamine amidotransferase